MCSAAYPLSSTTMIRAYNLLLDVGPRALSCAPHFG